MKIISLGGGERQKVACELLSEQYKDSSRLLILLPIPTSRDKEHITGTDISLLKAAELCKDGALLAGYAIPKELEHSAISLGAEVYDASFDEDFLKENADVTAKGALGHLLCDSKKVPSDMSVGVIGYGRIGKFLSEYLLFLGARLTVFSGRESVRVQLGEIGIDTRPFPTDDFSELDLIINTAPAEVMSEQTLFSLPKEVKIIELASGNNFPSSPRIVRLASVPEVMYPKTAGRIYAKYVAKHI